MIRRLPFAVADQTHRAFASAYIGYSGAPRSTVTAVVGAAAEWHGRTPAVACSGVLANRDRHDCRFSSREERRAQRACRRYVCSVAPQTLGVIGWIQIGVWLWQHRELIADLVRLFRLFLAERPDAFTALRERRIE